MVQELDDAFSQLSVTGSNADVDMFDGNALGGFFALQHAAHTILHHPVVRLLNTAPLPTSKEGWSA